MYKSVDSLIADISSSAFFKDNPHLIDDASIYRWVQMSLKKFGLNIMDKKAKVYEIKNFRGELDPDFGKISLAAWCQKDRCQINGNKEKLLSTYFYTDRVEQYFVGSIDHIATCKPEGCVDLCEEPVKEKRIIEKFFISDDCEVSLSYRNPIYVKLGRDVLRDSCVDGCMNRNISDSPYSINVKGNLIYANFKEGSLYVEYYSLPADEEGNPIIPKTDNGYLEEYIEYNIKRKILEDAMMSKDARDLFTLFQFIKAEEDKMFSMAQRDVSPMSMKSFWSAISKRRMDLAKYNINLGTNTFLTPR
jgi:hypothetical protein